MILLKPGVTVGGVTPEIVLALMVAEGVFEREKLTATVQSLTDSQAHENGSLHWHGCAVDLQTSTAGIGKDRAEILAQMLRGRLSTDYKVLVLAGYIHIEINGKARGERI